MKNVISRLVALVLCLSFVVCMAGTASAQDLGGFTPEPKIKILFSPNYRYPVSSQQTATVSVTGPNAGTVTVTISGPGGPYAPLTLTIGGTVEGSNTGTRIVNIPAESGNHTYTASATIANQNKSDDSTITAVKVAKIQWRNADDATAAFADAETLTVAQGARLEFKAVAEPTGAWPSEKPVWGGSAGGTGTGETQTITFPTVSTNATDYKTVSAECGNTVTANVVVYSGELKVKRKGTPDGDYAPSAIVVGGAKPPDEHKAEVLVQLSPALSGISVPLPTIIGGESAEPGQPGAAVISAVNATTDGSGKATFAFTSSNRIKEVTLRLDNGQTSPPQATVHQRWDDLVANDDNDPNRPKLWIYDPYFEYDLASPLTFKPKFSSDDGTTFHAITDHQMNFLNRDATVYVWNGFDYEPDTYEADETGAIVSQFAPWLTLVEFEPTQQVNDSGDGTYSSDQTVYWDAIEVVDSVSFMAQDDETYD